MLERVMMESRAVQAVQSCRSSIDGTCRFRPIQGGGFRLAIEVTRRCNLRCKHCFVPDEDSQPSAAGLIEVLQQAAQAGCRKVILTGGEPLLRRDLEDIIAACAGAGMLVDLNSNLLGLSAARARRLREAGLGEASVSLHGGPAAHDWLCGLEGCFARVVRGIEMLLGEGIAVDVHSALWDDSMTQLSSLVALCQEMGVASLTCFVILPAKRGAAPQEAFPLSRPLARQRIAAARREAAIPIRTIGLDSPDFSACVMGQGIFGVDAHMRLTPCLLAAGPQAPLSLAGVPFAAAAQQLGAQCAAGLWAPACVPQAGIGESSP
jgi:MoaA/NifB/PqqE/SkfB family radical SAM enzyme